MPKHPMIPLLALTMLLVAAVAPARAGDAAAATRWELAEAIALDEAEGLTQWAAGYRYIPPAVLMRPTPEQLWVVLAVPTATVVEDGAMRWRIAFAMDDGRIVIGKRLGGAAGEDERGAVDATVYGLPEGESPLRVQAVRVEAPAGAPALARIAAASRAGAAQKARIAALRAQVRLPQATLGQPFPFELAVLGGGTISSAGSRGRPLLIEIWATWCAPCVRSARDLAALQRRVGPERLALLGIALDSDAAAVQAFVDQHAAQWPQHVVGDDELGQALLEVIGFTGVPSYVLLDAEGIVRHRGSGSVDEQQIEQRLAELQAAGD